jgi:hypothetical protein
MSRIRVGFSFIYSCLLGYRGEEGLEVSLRHPDEDTTIQLALKLKRKVWVGGENM